MARYEQQLGKGEKYVFKQLREQEDSLSDTLSQIGAIKIKGREGHVDFAQFIRNYRVIPIIYNSDLSEQEIINLLQDVDLRQIKKISGEMEQYLYINPDTLDLTKEQRTELDLCAMYTLIYGIGPNDEYITYLDPDFLYKKKLQLIRSKRGKQQIETARGMMKNAEKRGEYEDYTLGSYYNYMNSIVERVQGLSIIDFSDAIYEYNGRTAVVPSPLRYITAETLVGISCQETGPRGAKTIQLPKDPNKTLDKKNMLKTEKPTDLVRAKMFELMLAAGYNPFTCFAIYDAEVSFGHTQAIRSTYNGLMDLPEGGTVIFRKLTKNSRTKFFDFFDKDRLVALPDEDKRFLQIPSKFEHCVNPEDQVLFSYYLSLYNFTKFMNIYMNPRNMTERSFLFVNAFANASEAERSKFVTAVTAAMHHTGERYPRRCFQSALEKFLRKREGNANFEDRLENVTLEDITNEFIKRLKAGPEEHAKTSMNIGQIVSRWYIEEEFVAATATDTSYYKSELTGKGAPTFGDLWEMVNPFHREIDNVVSLEIQEREEERIAGEERKDRTAMEGEEKRVIEFRCSLGKRRKLLVSSQKTRFSIEGHEKGREVDYYVFSFPNWADERELRFFLKDGALIDDIKRFNNISIFENRNDPTMQNAQVFWVPIDYVRFEGSYLGEINIPNNNRDKTEQVLEEFCIGGANEENLRIVQLCSNIYDIGAPNDRLLIPYSLLKRSARKTIDTNTR